MNIQIYWNLKNNTVPVNVDVSLIETVPDKIILHDTITVTDNLVSKFDFEKSLQNQNYDLFISRKEPLKDNQTTHDSWVVINKIVIDNFWKFTESNFPSYTLYNTEYYNSAAENGATWEIKKDRFNNVLFFSGSIKLELATPIRNMFWY